MFDQLEGVNSRPQPFEFYTTADLWTDEHTSTRMLAYHLNDAVDLSSRSGEFMDRSTQWIASHFQVGGHTRIADFGCGPGLYTTRLATLGAKVTGIDFSRRSIEHARSVAAGEGLTIEYVNQDYLHFETDNRFDLIIMIMCDFCVLSPAQRMAMLRTFHSLLSPGGAVLLDVCSLTAFAQRKEGLVYGPDLDDGFWSSERYHGFLRTFTYDEAKVVLDKYTIVEANRTRTLYNWLQCFSPEALQEEFEEGGFQLQEHYADVAGAPFDETSGEFAVVGRKA